LPVHNDETTTFVARANLIAVSRSGLFRTGLRAFLFVTGTRSRAKFEKSVLYRRRDVRTIIIACIIIVERSYNETIISYCIETIRRY